MSLSPWVALLLRLDRREDEARSLSESVLRLDAERRREMRLCGAAVLSFVPHQLTEVEMGLLIALIERERVAVLRFSFFRAPERIQRCAESDVRSRPSGTSDRDALVDLEGVLELACLVGHAGRSHERFDS